MSTINLWSAEIFLYKLWRPKGFLQFEIIINVLVRSVRFHLRVIKIRIYLQYFQCQCDRSDYPPTALFPGIFWTIPGYNIEYTLGYSLGAPRLYL